MKGRKEDYEDFGVCFLRSPICCVIGQASTGKTTLLDCIRGTDPECCPYTYMITATHVPSEIILERSYGLMNPKMILERSYGLMNSKAKIRVPGLLFLDTPGHTSYNKLISKGLALCDIAVLVVNTVLGLNPLTHNSLDLLSKSNKKFILVVNQVDRRWKPCENATFAAAFKQQSVMVQNAFNTKLAQIITQLKQYSEPYDLAEPLCIVPTCAKSGEGISDMLLQLVMRTQKLMVEKLTYREGEEEEELLQRPNCYLFMGYQCTVLYAYFIEGPVATIDVVLVNGTLHEGDKIIVYGKKVKIVTSIKSLLTPSPLREINNSKGNYVRHTKIQGGRAIKIIAKGLEYAIGHDDLYLLRPHVSKNVEERALVSVYYNF
ncbi:uncharacterized protein LOC131651363 [Vicia villosa]|uniref:uncharacterized protein LOC131651363 n=1 Tax=Vicia villosa TaxID=3911 RepID=UPI00273C2FF9|nr:uncharacterized protein LOC131651363 [Vicia villosa]